jgi:potassium efflux system protein
VIHYVDLQATPAETGHGPALHQPIQGLSPCFMRPLSRVIFILIFCWAFSRLEAQQPAESRPSATATPIPTMRVASEADATLEQLRETEASLAADGTVASVADSLSHLTGEIEARIADDSGACKSNPSLVMLHQLRLTWRSFGGELSAWGDELTRVGGSLDEQLGRQDRIAKTWQSTLQSVEQGAAPKDVLRRVQLVLDANLQSQQAVEARRTEVLILQDHLADEKSRVRTTVSLIEEAERRVLQQALVRDSPPIWSVQTSLLEEWSKNAGRAFSSQLSALASFAERLPFAFLIHALIIICLGVALYWVHRGLRRWSKQEPSLQPVVPVFALPLSAAVALSCLVCRLALYAQAPRLFLAILFPVALIATVRILRRLLSPKLFPILNALMIVFLVDELRETVAGLPLSARLLLLSEGLGAVVFLIWLIQSRRLGTASDNSGQRSARVSLAAAWIGLIFFSASFLAAIFGYVSLANILADLYLWGAYLITILYGAIRIVDGLVLIILWMGPLVTSRVVRVHRVMLHQRIGAGLKFLAFLLWLSVILSSFGLREPVVDRVETFLNANLAIGSLNVSLGRILAFVLTVWASFLFSKFLRFLLEEDVYHHFRLARGIPQAISTMVHFAVLLLGFFVAMAALGVDLNKVTILAGAFTVGVGFGLQNIINNFVSGLILLFERPIKVGDVIEVSDKVGEVRKIGIRASVIRTPDGSEVIVPNGTLISNQVTNWTFSDQQRAVEVPVTVVRGTAPQRVVELLKTVARDHPLVAKDPAPQAYISTFTSGTVTFQLRAWTARYEDWVQLRSDLAVAMDEALAREHISIP